MKRISIVVVSIAVLLLVFSCSSQHSTRKCNGKKGIKTPMGLM